MKGIHFLLKEFREEDTKIYQTSILKYLPFVDLGHRMNDRFQHNICRGKKRIFHGHLECCFAWVYAEKTSEKIEH